MYQISDRIPMLTELPIPRLAYPLPDHKLASVVEFMRLTLFIFVLSLSFAIPQIGHSQSLALFFEVAANFEQYFNRAVPTIFED